MLEIRRGGSFLMESLLAYADTTSSVVGMIRSCQRKDCLLLLRRHGFTWHASLIEENVCEDEGIGAYMGASDANTGL